MKLLRLLAVPLAALALASCGRDAPLPAGPDRCEVPLTVPDGFEVTGGIEDEYPDRIGVRIDLRAEDGRELHLFAGIRGEFGEGLPPAGSVVVGDGIDAALLGRGDVWVARWERDGPCGSGAALGSGMTRKEFVGVLRDAAATDT